LSVGRTAPDTIEAYLSQLAAALYGPREWKRRVLAETEDGLRCEFDALIEDGLPAVDAAARTLRDWGDVHAVAAEFNVSGRALWARRMARNILQWTPILVIGWGLVVQLSPDPWRAEPVLISWLVPLLFAAMVAAVVGSVQLARRAARSALSGGEMRGVACACAGVGVGVAVLLILFCYRLVASGWHMYWPGSIVSGALTMLLLASVVFDAWHLLPATARRARTSRFMA
jgi:hypothetical protein